MRLTSGRYCITQRCSSAGRTAGCGRAAALSSAGSIAFMVTLLLNDQLADQHLQKRRLRLPLHEVGEQRLLQTVLQLADWQGAQLLEPVGGEVADHRTAHQRLRLLQ